MDKEIIITQIEQLYPADSQYIHARKTGKELLLQAICNKWRSLPIEILTEYLNLCEDNENG